MTLIALSGFSGEEQTGKIRACGFDHYLIKPASFAKIRGILQQPHADR